MLENSQQKPCFRTDLFDKKTALVTGAGRGIGLAIAQALNAGGIAKMILLGRDAARLARTMSDLTEHSSADISTYVLDLSSPEQVQKNLDVIKESAGDVDILINNAGVYQTSSVQTQSLSDWQRVIDINLTASMLFTRAFLPAMMQRKWGRIVNVSSISGKAAEAYGAAYSASKFALVGFTQSCALEASRDKVTVNAVCPGWVATDLAFDQINDPDWQSLNGLPADDAMEITRLSVPQERFIEPYEVASLAAFLCTEEARGITGQAINVCGGLSLQ